MLGGGIARGRVVEIFGPESCGKTSLAVCIMAEAQKQFPSDNVVLMDLESSFDISYGMRLGLKDTNCYIGTFPVYPRPVAVCTCRQYMIYISIRREIVCACAT